MTSPSNAPHIFAVDVATTGVRVLVAEQYGEGIGVLGLGAARRWTLRSGVVADPTGLEAAIRDAIRATGMDPADASAYVGVPRHATPASKTPVRRDAGIIVKCCWAAGLPAREIIPAVVGSALAVSTPETRAHGVGAVNLGAGPARLAVYLDGKVYQVGAARRGGQTVIGDVAIGLRTPVTAAERIVIEHGCAMPGPAPVGELVEVPSLGGRQSRAIERRTVAELIHRRLVEIFTELRELHLPSDLRDRLGSGIVLTGGFSRLPAIADLAHEVFDVPVRLGTPVIAGRDDLGPEHATVVGLALLAASEAGAASRMSPATAQAGS